jgi:hypothetical protein
MAASAPAARSGPSAAPRRDKRPACRRQQRAAPHPLDDRRLVRVGERRILPEFAVVERVAVEEDAPADPQSGYLAVLRAARSQDAERAHPRHGPADRRRRESEPRRDVGDAKRTGRIAELLHQGEKREHAQLPVRQVLDGESEALGEDGEERRAEGRLRTLATAVDHQARHAGNAQLEHRAALDCLGHHFSRCGCVDQVGVLGIPALLLLAIVFLPVLSLLTTLVPTAATSSRGADSAQTLGACALSHSRPSERLAPLPILLPAGWYTPPWVIRELGGRFDTDPCAPRRRHWTAKTCYTIKEDGLKQPWKGLVFCNPPYSNAMPWVEKMMGHQPGGVFLVPVRQSFWYQDLALATATAFVLLDTRLSFVGLDGEPVGKGASADVFSLIVWGGEALIRVQRALLRGIDMLPGEDKPPKGERLTGRLYFEREAGEMRTAIGLPISGGDGEWPPEDDEAEAARLTAEGDAWERFLERKRRRQNLELPPSNRTPGMGC